MPALAFPARNKLAYPAGTRAGFDPSHPGSGTFAGLISAVPSGGNFINRITGGSGIIEGALTSGNEGIIGPCVANFGGTGSLRRIHFAATAFGSTANITLGAIFRSDQQQFSNQSIASLDQSAFMFLDAAGASVLRLFSNSGSISSGFSIGLNTPYFAAASANATTVKFVLKNLISGAVQSTTVSNANTAFSGASFIIGGDFVGGGGTDDFAGSIAAAMMSFTFLREEALMGWADDPWAFWYPPQTQLQIAAAAAAAAQYAAFSLPQRDGGALTRMIGY